MFGHGTNFPTLEHEVKSCMWFPPAYKEIECSLFFFQNSYAALQTKIIILVVQVEHGWRNSLTFSVLSERKTKFSLM